MYRSKGEEKHKKREKKKREKAKDGKGGAPL